MVGVTLYTPARLWNLIIVVLGIIYLSCGIFGLPLSTDDQSSLITILSDPQKQELLDFLRNLNSEAGDLYSITDNSDDYDKRLRQDLGLGVDKRGSNKWSIAYGKRAPGKWSIAYGKRTPGKWKIAYGKRAPGKWSIAYGKRDPWNIAYDNVNMDKARSLIPESDDLYSNDPQTSYLSFQRPNKRQQDMPSGTN